MIKNRTDPKLLNDTCICVCICLEKFERFKCLMVKKTCKFQCFNVSSVDIWNVFVLNHFTVNFTDQLASKFTCFISQNLILTCMWHLQNV